MQFMTNDPQFDPRVIRAIEQAHYGDTGFAMAQECEHLRHVIDVQKGEMRDRDREYWAAINERDSWIRVALFTLAAAAAMAGFFTRWLSR
jgi:hypothetical protein